MYERKVHPLSKQSNKQYASTQILRNNLKKE